MANKRNTPHSPFIVRRIMNPAVHGTDQQTLRELKAPVTLANSYLLSSSQNRMSAICDSRCFAVRLAEFILEGIGGGIFPVNGEGRFNDCFYNFIMNAAESAGLIGEIGDRELLLIYIKQTVAILRKSRVIRAEDGIARTEDPHPEGSLLFTRLFNTFWNDLEWEEIFTSNTDLASDMKNNRCILADLTLRHSGPVEIETVAGDFFDLTGFSRRGDLFSISFLDFYFFTWLRHFGIIEYSSPSDDAPVTISVTTRGRILLKAAI